MDGKGNTRPQRPRAEAQGKTVQGKRNTDGLQEKPISGAYSTIDTDLARDNLENDIPAADLEDL